MDYPRIPDDSRDWRSIEIFLFTNGQEYSPPRKYHLKTEELKFWDGTLNFLARSQFGSLHSNIELYTLDGKKINTPLELLNDTAYVAVNPPDAFVQSGYEKYLLKASRSRERRHEKLNKTEIVNSGNIDMEQVTSNWYIPHETTNNNEEKQNDNLWLATEYLATIENNTLAKSQKDTESLKQHKTNNISLLTEKPEWMQRRKPGSNTKNTILKKICSYNSKNKEGDLNVNKNTNASLPRNHIKTGNNFKRLTRSSNNKNILKTNLEDKIRSKEKPLINNITTAENKIETKQNTELLKTNKSPNRSEKDLTVLSDVYKNIENDIPSVFLGVDRKTELLSNRQINEQITSVNIDKLGETKSTKGMCQHCANNLCDLQASHEENQPDTFNINLKIDLNGYTVMTTEEEKSANKYKTFITLVKPEKATQVNINVNLSRETLNIGDKKLCREQSVESDIAKTNEEVSDSKTNVIVHCKCNILKSGNNASLPHNFEGNDLYLIVIPTEKMDKFMPRGDLETVRGSDKEILELLNSGIHVPLSFKTEKVGNKNLSISLDATTEHNLDNVVQLKSQGDITIQPTLPNDLNKPKYRTDNFAQTNWCNILLQAKCDKDGRYTFHLPPLHVLMHYNLL